MFLIDAEERRGDIFSIKKERKIKRERKKLRFRVYKKRPTMTSLVSSYFLKEMAGG